MDSQQFFEKILKSDKQDALNTATTLPSGLKFNFDQLSGFIQNIRWETNDNLPWMLLASLSNNEHHIEQLTVEQVLLITCELLKKEEDKEKIFEVISKSLNKWQQNGIYYIMSEEDMKDFLKNQQFLQFLQKMPKLIKFESSFVALVASNPSLSSSLLQILETIVNKQLLNKNCIKLADLINAVQAAQANSKFQVMQQLFKLLDSSEYPNMCQVLDSIENIDEAESIYKYLKSQRENEYANGKDPFNLAQSKKSYSFILDIKDYSTLMLQAVYELNKTQDPKTLLSYQVLFKNYGPTFPNLPSKYLIVPEEEMENFKREFGTKDLKKVQNISEDEYKETYANIFKLYHAEQNIFQQPKSGISSVYEKYEPIIQSLPDEDYNQLIKEVFDKIEDPQQIYDIISYQNVKKIYNGNISKKIPKGYVLTPDEDIERIGRIYCIGSKNKYKNVVKKGQVEKKILKKFMKDYPAQQKEQVKA
ncbi:hypothetical protein ABPG72_005455 [Tetrahymena utriculariae]